jgi:hypothetical protein
MHSKLSFAFNGLAGVRRAASSRKSLETRRFYHRGTEAQSVPFVITGRDPVIQSGLDCRVEPGNDKGGRHEERLVCALRA